MPKKNSHLQETGGIIEQLPKLRNTPRGKAPTTRGNADGLNTSYLRCLLSRSVLGAPSPSNSGAVTVTGTTGAGGVRSGARGYSAAVCRPMLRERVLLLYLSVGVHQRDRLSEIHLMVTDATRRDANATQRQHTGVRRQQ